MTVPTLAKFREQHVLVVDRRRGGVGAISGRQLYNFHGRCSCGWTDTSNSTRAEQESYWKWHTRDEWNKLKAAPVVPSN